MTLNQAIRAVIILAARQAGGNKSEMARILDVYRPRVYHLLRQHNINLADAVRSNPQTPVGPDVLTPTDLK